MVEAIQILHDISDFCVREEELSSQQLCWLGESLERFLSHESDSLDQAVGCHEPLTIRFREGNHAGFYRPLKARVCRHFEASKKSRFADHTAAIKVAVYGIGRAQSGEHRCTRQFSSFLG